MRGLVSDGFGEGRGRDESSVSKYVPLCWLPAGEVQGDGGGERRAGELSLCVELRLVVCKSAEGASRTVTKLRRVQLLIERLQYN